MLDQELGWTWLHCSCRSLNISSFSNNLFIKQFYLFVSLHKTLSFTHTLRSHLTHYCSGDLGTLSLGIPYHTCNATKVSRETTVFFFHKAIIIMIIYELILCAAEHENDQLRITTTLLKVLLRRKFLFLFPSFFLT